MIQKNHFKVKWNSLQETLPMKKAIAFHLDKQEQINQNIEKKIDNILIQIVYY